MKELKELVYENNNGHKEVGGLVKLEYTGKGYVARKLDTKIVGTGDETSVPADKFGYMALHTHPSGQYDVESVSAAWPSGVDLDSICSKMTSNYENAIGHMVATKEGIWLVTLSSEAMSRGRKDLEKNGKQLADDYYQRDLPKKSENGEEAIREYIQDLAGLPKNKKVFDIQLYSWPKRMRMVDMVLSATRPSCDGGSCNSLEKCQKSDF